jgi:hypothetical protein
MKLAWYTPYSRRSAIALFSKEVVSSLLELGHEVTIIRSEAAHSDSMKTSRERVCEVITAESIDSNVTDYLGGFDCVLYNIGNHLGNHYYCLPHQAQMPGITVLHDYILHNLLIEWLQQHNNESYLDKLNAEAGKDAVQSYQAASDDLSRKWFMSQCADFPVLRFAMKSTLGVVTHAKFYASMCSSRLQCPVTTIPLAFCVANERKLELPKFKHLPMRLITIGDANVNKRFESVIQAIGESKDLSSTWQYRIVGGISKSYEELLTKLALGGRYPVDLVILGKVDDSALHQELENSHAIACLRYPIIEGASASAIVSLASARPTLVSGGGCYGEIPDECIYRVRHSHEFGDIQKQLAAISSDYGRAIAKAQAARSWSVERHSGRQYVKSLLPFIDKVAKASPCLQLADTVSTYLSNWKVSPQLPLIDRIDAESTALFGELF